MAVALLGFVGGSVALVLTGGDSATSAVAAEQGETAPAATAVAATSKEATPVNEPVIQKTAEGCLADSATLEDLRRQKIELEKRQSELNAREAELKAREQALSDQMKGLATARDEIEKIEQGRKGENEAKIAKLVETVETMNPKTSSALLASLDEDLATATMARLSTPKLAKILNVMDPARATRLSELLAGVARAKSHTTSHDVAVATTVRTPASSKPAVGPSKGGDTNDGKSHE